MFVWKISYSRVSFSAAISSTSSDLPAISAMSSRPLDQRRPSSTVPSSACIYPFTLVFLTFSFTMLPFGSLFDCDAVTLHRPPRFRGRHSLSRRPVQMGLMSGDGLWWNGELRLFAMIRVWRPDDDSLQNIFFFSLLFRLPSSPIPASSLYTSLDTILILSFLKIKKYQTIKLVYIFVFYFIHRIVCLL